MKTTNTTIAAALLVAATSLTLPVPAGAQTPTPKPPALAEYAAAPLPKADEEGIRKTVMGVEESLNTHDTMVSPVGTSSSKGYPLALLVMGQKTAMPVLAL